VVSVDSDHNALDVYMRGGSISVSGGSSAVSPGTIETFISSDPQFTPGTTATDIWTMYGSGTKTVKIYFIGLLYIGNGGGQANMSLLRRSTTNTGGTSSTTTPVKLDSTNASATATIRTYTANPSALGTTVGQLLSVYLVPAYVAANISIFTSPVADTPLFDYRLVGQPITLRGTSEGIALNCGGTTPTGGTLKMSVRVIFTEE
jgi:hypothetical protein